MISLMEKNLVKKTLPWLTQELSSLAQKLNGLYRKAKSSNLYSTWLSFHNPRNKAVSAYEISYRLSILPDNFGLSTLS